MQQFSIITDLNAYEIKQQFQKIGRDNFSVEAIEALCDLYESASRDGAFKIDYVGWDCEYHESDPQSLREEHDYLFEDNRDYSDIEIYEIFSNNTTAILLNNGNLLINTMF